MHALNHLHSGDMGNVMEKFDDIFVYNTFFYTKLLHDTHALYSWYKAVDLFSKILLVPVYQAEYAHWCLVVADVANKQTTNNKQMTFYDSLIEENSVCWLWIATWIG